MNGLNGAKKELSLHEIKADTIPAKPFAQSKRKETHYAITA
jgi:hypothetical protein